jgi:hypothetical protein
MKKSPLASTLVNALLLLVTCAVALGLAEVVALRLMSRPAPVFPDSRFAHRRWISNSRDQRDFEYPVEKPPGTFRVIAIGDSFTYGHGAAFDDVWPKRLERYLYDYQNVKGWRYEVLNWGKSGRATPSEVGFLKANAKQFGADLIVVGYCLNDAETETGDLRELSALREKTVKIAFDKGTGLNAWLYDHWALYRFVRIRLFNRQRNAGHLAYYPALYRDEYQGWKDTRAAIAELGAFSKESGIPAVVLIFPLLSWNLDERYPFPQIHDKIHRELEKAGLGYVDLLPAYHGLDHTVLEAVPFQDPHPSDVAHRIAAEELYVYLRDKGLLPKGEKMRVGRQLPPPWR